MQLRSVCKYSAPPRRVKGLSSPGTIPQGRPQDVPRRSPLEYAFSLTLQDVKLRATDPFGDGLRGMMRQGGTRLFRTGGTAAPLAAALLLLSLCGCSSIVVPMEPAIPAAESGPDPAVSENPTQADAVMTCDTIATERAGIAASLKDMGDSAAAAKLRRRDGELASVAALKRCP